MDPKRQYELIQELTKIVNELDWVIGLPEGDIVPGLIIGTEEFVTQVVEAYGIEYTKFTEDPTGENSLVETPIDVNKKPKTYH